MATKSPLVFGIDLEGVNENLESGINTDTDRVTEVGALLWDWEVAQPVSFHSFLLDEPGRPDITEELVELTGITDSMLFNHGFKKEDIPRQLEALIQDMDKADYIIAHNGRGYDQPMLEALFKRYDKNLPIKVWIDSSSDIEYPRSMKQRSLMALEHYHGFVNPFPHRAVTDVMSMLKVASQYNLDRMAQLAISPVVELVAEFSPPNWNDPEEVEKFNRIKNKVAKSGFRWNPQKKIWSRRVHRLLLDEKKLEFEFKTRVKNTFPAGSPFYAR